MGLCQHTLFSFNSGSQTFSDRLLFVGRVVSPRSTLIEENPIYQNKISFDQKYGKPELTQTRHEQNSCEKL